MLSSFRAVASSSSRIVDSHQGESSASASAALRHKGKGRATSPETPDATFCFSIGDDDEERHMTTTAGGILGIDESLQQHLSPSTLSDTPKSIDSASPLTPPIGLSASNPLQPPWDRNEPRGVSIDLGDPFTFDPFTNHQHSYRSKPSALGLRRRPYQSGILPASPLPQEDNRMSRTDRISIFSGLRSSAARSPSLSSQAAMNESMSSSSKRSFEEAISPISSPSSSEGGTSNALQRESSSRGFSSSLSNSFDSLRRNHDAPTSTTSPFSQTTRRRLPHKRRRAAATSPSLSGSGSTVPLDDSMLHLPEDSASNLPSEANHADITARELMPVDRISQAWPTLRSSFEGSGETSVDNVDLPSSTTQLLRRWWVDAEEASSSTSQSSSHHSTVAEMGSEQGNTMLRAGQISPSSAISVSGSIPGSHTVLRRLQLREREEEEDVQVDDAPLEATQDTDYHNQLMDVFRRMNERSSQGIERVAPPRPPLRSTTMTRSTTQVSEALSRSNSQLPDNTAVEDSDLGDIISSYLESDDAVRQRRVETSSSIRTFDSQRAIARQTQASSSTRLSALQAQSNSDTYREIARRNQQVLDRYSNAESRVRPRHQGSPTFPLFEVNNATSLRDGLTWSQDFGAIPRDTGESTFNYRPPSSRRPARSLAPLSLAQSNIESDASLWGEYLLSRGPQRQDAQPIAVDEQTTPTSTSAAESTSTTSQYLTRLSERLSSNTASATAARRRVGALDSSGRLRGPTRRQNETWLGMSSGEEVDGAASDAVQQNQEMVQLTPSLEEQEQVMSTYRQMSFPDPESSTATLTHQETSHSLNRPPQLPSLRSRSPFELPFTGMPEPSTPTLSTDQMAINLGVRAEAPDSSTSVRQPARPLLRPLTLSSRLGSSLSNRIARRETTTVPSIPSDRRPFPTFRLSDTTTSTEDLVQRPASRIESPPRTPSELRQLFEETGDSDVMMDHLDSLSSRRRRRRSQYDSEQRDQSQSAMDSAASLHLSRRLPVHSLSLSRTLRQRSSAGLHTRRRPTLLESDSSAVDVEVPNRDRFDLDSLMASSSSGSALRHQEEQSSSTSRSRFAPPSLASSSREASRRSLSRWDRYMDDVGSSIGFRSIMEAQAQEMSSATPSFASYLSRLPGGSLAASLHSEIATNPANYVADDDFALRDSYEGLLQLSAQIGDVRCKYTPPHVIAKLPTCLYAHWLGGSCKTTTLDQRSHTTDLDVLTDLGCLISDKGKARAREDSISKDTSCSICLESYSACDTVMSLPCNHAFHETCVVAWLKTARSCPCCRGDVCADEAASTALDSSIPPSLRILPELYF